MALHFTSFVQKINKNLIKRKYIILSWKDLFRASSNKLDDLEVFGRILQLIQIEFC